MIKAVLFDFDGTLMDTQKAIEETWKHIFKEIRNIDVDEETLKSSYGEPWRNSFRISLSMKPLRFLRDIKKIWMRRCSNFLTEWKRL